MDDAVGRILKQLRDDGLEERTLIFFLSDNGGTTENNTSSNTPLRGRKGRCGKAASACRSSPNGKACCPPEKPTTAPSAASTSCPPPSPPPVPPASPASLSTASTWHPSHRQKIRRPPRMLFWRIAERDIWAVRSGDHKLIKQGQKPNLYDLASDIRESRDLAGKMPEVQASLQKAYDEWSATLPKPLWTVYQNPGAQAADEARRMRNRLKQ
jgi:hypothetical protein